MGNPMNPEVNSRLNSWIKAFPRFAGAAAIVAGSIVIVGWILDVQVLKSLHSSLVSMKANAALAFMLAGISLLLHSSPGTGKLRIAARFLASLVLLVGVITVAEYAFKWDAGIDRLLFDEPEGTIGTLSPGRMAFNSAINFCFFGLALLTLRRRGRWGDGLAQVLALVVGLLGLLGLMAHMYGLSGSSGYAVYTRMALHTAVTFILLSTGFICLQPDVGIMAVIRGEASGGFMARRLMLAAIGIPLGLGWLVAQGEMIGLYGPQFGDVIDATAYIGIFMFLVWTIGRSMNALDSERKSAAEALRQTEAHYRLMVEHASDLIYNVDSRGYITFVNPATVRMMGYLPNEVVGRRYVEFVRPDFQKRAERLFITQFLRKTPSVYNEAPVLTKDGRELWLSQNVGLVFKNDEVMGFHAVSRDITERKRAEEALAWEEYLLNALLQNVPDHIYFKDTESRFMRISRAQAEIFGLSDPSQAVGKTDSDFFTEEHARLAYEDEQEIIRTGRLLSKEEKETWSDRPDTWVLTTKMPLRDEEGKIIGTFGISRDITDRKRAEDALAKKTELFRLVSSSTTDYIFVDRVTDDGKTKLDLLIGALEQITGYTEEEYRAIGDWSATIHPDDREKDDRDFQKLLNNEKVVSEIRTLRKDGSTRWMKVYADPIWDGMAKRVVGISGAVQDITEQKRAEQERESMIGELKAALDNVRTLGGLVPICAHCKKIRDDKGYWNQLEKYLIDHTDAKLTHGLCPDCTKLYFPEDAAKSAQGGAG